MSLEPDYIALSNSIRAFHFSLFGGDSPTLFLNSLSPNISDIGILVYISLDCGKVSWFEFLSYMKQKNKFMNEN